MDSFDQILQNISQQAKKLKADKAAGAAESMPSGAHFLSDNGVLCPPRDNGDSRYPYGSDGFNFWVYASGYMHSNEGLFSHFVRAAEGQEPNIAFFAALPSDNDSQYSILPLLSVPRVNGSAARGFERNAVLTSTAAYFISESPQWRFAVRIFVNAQHDVCFTLQARNLTDTPQKVLLSSYINPFLRNQLFKSGEDRWFKQGRALKPTKGQGELGSFLIEVNEDIDRTTSITNHGIIRRTLDPGENGRLLRHEETASRNQYVGGTRSSLHTPTSLFAGTFGEPTHLCTFTQTAIAGDILELEVPPTTAARADYMFSFTMDPDNAATQVAATIDPELIDKQLTQIIKFDEDNHTDMTLKVGGTLDPRINPDVFNGFIEHLKRQVDFCALIKGYIQLAINSLVGIRDVFQALEALAFWRPGPTREKMIEALSYTNTDGRCYRQYSLPTSTGAVGRMDLRLFIDQGVWVISAIATYLRVTGDRDFLNENCGYHEIVDEQQGKVQSSDKTDSVLEHLIKITDYLLAQRDHDGTGCVRALYGDWNDALDGLGVSLDPNEKYGSGVSVMVTLQVYQNCYEMIEILESIDPSKHAKQIERYKKAGDELAEGLKKSAIVQNDQGEKRIVHGWGDKQSYYVGSFKDPDGLARDGLTSNAFWVSSGLLARDPSLSDPILASFKRLDSKYGYKTFEPAFDRDVKGVGRIPKLPPGTAENGATYVHATAFAVMSLFQMGHARDAWEQMVKILPFTDLHGNLSHSPFVMPNSYGENPDLFIDGQNMNDWQTGSSNVVLKLLIRFVFGFEPALDGFWVQPAAWSPFESLEINLKPHGRDVKITSRYSKNSDPAKRQFTVNGKPAEGQNDETLGSNKLWIAYDQVGTGPIEVTVTQ